MDRELADLELVRRCIARAPGAWRQFVDRFGPTVLALARRNLRHQGRPGDTATAEDVTQEVFLALMRRNYKLLRDYDDRWTVKTWLGVITRTQVHRQLRRRTPRPAGDTDLEPMTEPQPDPTEQVERIEEHDRLLAALDALPERDAELLRHRFFKERDYKTIAGLMGLSEASIGQLLFRAKQRLIEELERGPDSRPKPGP